MCAGRDQVRLAVDDVEADVHLRLRAQRLDQRVADDVGERDLAAAGAGEVVVDDRAVVPEQLDRHRPHRRGRRAPSASCPCCVDRAGRRAAQHGERAARRWRPGARPAAASLGTGLLVPLAGSAAFASGRGLATGAGAGVGVGSLGSGSGSASALGLGLGARASARPRAPAWPRPRPRAPRWSPRCPEVRHPRRVDARRVLLEAVVHLLDQPLVGAELLGDRAGTWPECWWMGCPTAARLLSPLPVGGARQDAARSAPRGSRLVLPPTEMQGVGYPRNEAASGTLVPDEPTRD